MFRAHSVLGKFSFMLVTVVAAVSAQAARAEAPKLGVVDRPAFSGGMRVVRVIPGTAADEMGLQPGDVIISVNGNLVSEYGDIADALYGSDYAHVIWLSFGQYFEGYAPLYPVFEEEYRMGGSTHRHAMTHKKIVRRNPIRRPR